MLASGRMLASCQRPEHPAKAGCSGPLAHGAPRGPKVKNIGIGCPYLCVYVCLTGIFQTPDIRMLCLGSIDSLFIPSGPIIIACALNCNVPHSFWLKTVCLVSSPSVDAGKRCVALHSYFDWLSAPYSSRGAKGSNSAISEDWRRAVCWKT